MSFHAASAQVIAQRHPVEYADLVQKMTMSRARSKTPESIPADPQDWAWGYESAVRIDNHSPDIDGLTGRDLLTAGVDHLWLTISVKAGRKQEYHALDNQALLAGSDHSLPLEALGVRAKPQGQPLWLWQGEDAARPGWHEAVLMGAARDPAGGLLMRLQTDANWELNLIHIPGKNGWHRATGAHQVSKAPARMGRVVDTGVAEKGIVPMTLEDLVNAGLLDASLHVVTGNANVADLVAALSRDPAFMAIGQAVAQNQETTPELADLPVVQGRHWAWCSARDTAYAAGKAALDCPKVFSRPAFGNAMDMFQQLGSPQAAVQTQLDLTHEKVVKRYAKAYATGMSVPEALDAARLELLARVDPTATTSSVTDLWRMRQTQIQAKMSAPASAPARPGRHGP